MKRAYKITAWILGGIVLLAACVIGGFALRDVLNPPFEETRIYPDESRLTPSDTIVIVNGIPIKMIGVRGGKIDCQGLKETIELGDFRISETEVTQGLWSAVMDYNPSVRQDGDSLPVENVDLVDCLEFVHRLDSVTGHSFYIPSYPQWLYVAHLGNKTADANALDSIAWHKGNADNMTHSVKHKSPNSLGVYDMIGNVTEWTMSGSDPLFIVAGGSFDNEMEHVDADFREFYHGKIKTGTLGFRLVSYPADVRK